MSETLAGRAWRWSWRGGRSRRRSRSSWRRGRRIRGAQGYAPVLAMVLLGDDKPSRAYSRRIAKTCEEVGLRYRPVELADDVDEEALRLALET